MLWEPAIYEHKAALIGKSPVETACSADLLTESLLKEYEVYGADFLCVGIDIYNIEAEACGAELTVAGINECPDIAAPIFDPMAIPEQLSLPDIPQSGRFQLLLDAARRVRDKLSGQTMVRVAASGPVTIAAKLAGLDGVVMSLALEDGQVERLLDFTTELCSAWCRAINNAGLDAIIFDSMASPPMLSPDIFDRHVMPLYSRLMSQLDGAGQAERELVLGGNTTPVAGSLVGCGATTLVCDYIADAAAYAAAAGLPDIKIRRNIAPSALCGDISGAISKYLDDLAQFKHPVCGTGILPYSFNPKDYQAFRDTVEASRA